MTSSQQQQRQHRFNIVAKTVHASFAKAAGSDALALCAARIAAAEPECFEGGRQQQGCKKQ
jgi:hypothetical protein